MAGSMLSGPKFNNLCKETLSLEGGDPIPTFYPPILREFLSTNPVDVHFTLELADGKGNGGNGFGLVVCMDDYCWNETFLDADPNKPLEEQRMNGLGSLFNYRMHCASEDHMKGRLERCEREDIPVQVASNPLQSHIGSDESPVEQQPASSQPGPSNTSRAQPLSSTHSATTSTAGPPPHSTSSFDVPQNVDRTHASSSSSSSRLPTLTSPSSSTQNPFTALYDSPYSLSPVANKAATKSTAARETTTSSMRPVLQLSQADNTAGPCSASLDPDIKPTIAASSTRLSSDSHPVAHWVDDDSDVEELTGSAIPTHMQKQTNRHNPIVLLDDEPGPSSLPAIAESATTQGGTSSLHGKLESRFDPTGAISRSLGGRPAAPLYPLRLPRLEARSRFNQEMTMLSRAARAAKTGPGNKRALADQISARMQSAFAMSHNPETTLWSPPPKELQARVLGLTHLVTMWENADRCRVDAGTPSTKTGKLSTAVANLQQLGQTSTPSQSPALAGPSRLPQSSRGITSLHASRSFEHFNRVVHDTPGESSRMPESEPDYYAYGRPFTSRSGKPSSATRTPLPKLEQTELRMPGAMPSVPKSEPDHLYSEGVSYQLPCSSVHPAYASSGSSQIAGPSMPKMEHLIDSKPGFFTPHVLPEHMTLGNIAMGSTGAEIDAFDYGYEFDRPTTAEDLQTFFANSLNEFGDDADVEGALAKLGLKDMHDKVPGLLVNLMAHQVLGVKFMIAQEQKASMRGGMLLDEQGLGKTIQTIGVLVANPSQDKKVKTTLIVAPLALLQQWKAEIESKTSMNYKIAIHHGSKRSKSINELKSYDIVLTTYGTLAAEHGKEKPKKAYMEGDDGEDVPRPAIARAKGPLFRMRFYRVVLDEAQFVRNRATKAARACFDLNAHLRWSLTGTPIVNSLVDVFSQLHFLQISFQKNWPEFQNTIGRIQKKKPKLAATRVQAILKTCSIRRNKDTELNGVRLLTLPEKTVEVEELVFTEEEREMYNAIERRMQVRFNNYLKRGTVLRNYSDVLSMLLRLKQLCCHPYLLRRDPNDASAHPHDMMVSDAELFGTRDVCHEDDLAETKRAVELMGQQWVDSAIKKLQDRYDDDKKRSEDPDEVLGAECAICTELFGNEHEERMAGPCQHSYCATCIDEFFKSGAGNADLTDEQVERNIRNCPQCRAPIEREKLFRASAFWQPPAEEHEDGDGPALDAREGSQRKRKAEPASDDDEDVKPAQKLFKGKGKAKASNVEEEAGSEKLHKDMGLEDVEEIRPSTKMRRMARMLDQYLEEDPHTKIIVFSQFTSYIDLCQLYMRHCGVNSLSYVGSMKPFERDATIAAFNRPAEEGSPRIMFISLKCGGVGLNLTVASKVISLDLAWNAATELQAWDRCHRIGQTRPVHIMRAVIADTVEQRILALQESKKSLADGALGEGTGGKLGRLSVRDLVNLFGLGEQRNE